LSGIVNVDGLDVEAAISAVYYCMARIPDET